ncbi:MAG: META domain-containing protein [Planctomycetota bacterium]
MNWPLLCRLLGLLAMLVGGSMTLSLPWAFPFFGQVKEVETRGALALGASIAFAGAIGGGLWWIGRSAGKDTILRKEALAVVGLGWILAGVIGALPLYLSGSYRQFDPEQPELNVPVTFADTTPNIEGFWKLVQIAGEAPAVDVTVLISSDTFEGGGYCHHYKASYTLEGSRLSVGQVSAYEVGCVRIPTPQEPLYFASIEAAQSVAVEGDVLTITAPKATLIYRRTSR